MLGLSAPLPRERDKKSKTCHALPCRRWFVSPLLAAFVGAVYSRDVLRLLFPESYWDAWLVIPLLAFHHVFAFMARFWIAKLQYNKTKVHYALVPTYVHLGMMVLLCLILVPMYSVIGAAVALLVARILAMMTVHFGLKSMPPLICGFPLKG